MMKSFYPLLLLLLCLLPAAGRESTAQNNPDELQKMAGSQYRLTGLKMSEDGKWLTIRKSYDLSRDTVLIFNSRYPEKPVGYRTKVSGIFFPDADHLLMQGPDQAELLNLKENTGIYYQGVKQIQLLESKKEFLLHYNESGNDKLEWMDSKGSLLNVLEHVKRFFVSQNNQVYAIGQTADSAFQIIHFEYNSKRPVYRSANTIEYIKTDPGAGGLMIYERNQESTFQEIRYLDVANNTCFALNQVLPVSVQNGFREVIREGSLYFLRLWVHREKEDTALVDIWYGSDNKLEQKFHPPVRDLYYVWAPREKRVWQTGTGQLTQSVNTGSERYFLSFNPHLLNNYTRPAPLEINSYDRLENRYAVIDTIAPELYASPAGEDILYPKNNLWYACRLPAQTKRVIESSRIKTPYFTPDSKTVIFEGDGGLWRYGLQEGELIKLTDFEGYQTAILNGHTAIIGNFRFYKNTVNLEKPLVVKLFDPSAGRSAYVLWENGKYRTIIAPTTRRIQSLSYNNSLTCFSWLEEDYNLPPRLAYKEMGKQERVLYQSNQQDKAILSLRQEIISYTNSDSIPLKGILYYPLNYTVSKQYPLVVHIYQLQREKTANEYPVATYGKANSDGFNLRLLLENGYFVYFPDIVYGQKGTGLSALDCVNHALDTVSSHALIDQDKIGLIGHSHGGYETNFIATHSTRFAAYVSGAGNSDIVRSYFSFNYNFLSPFYWQYETGQYEIGKSFREDKNLYFQNNPIYYADQVNAPVLLWTGKKDRNIDWEQTMEFYTGLKRNNKKVVALFYPGEGHALYSAKACRDLVSRILDWFNYFLKGEENAGWIDKEMRKDAW